MKPTVWISETVLERFDTYIEAADGEISGLGRVIQNGDSLYVTELFLLPQRCDTALTELDPQGVQDFLVNLIENDGRPEEIKLWWHSHGRMQVFWSVTDDKTAESFGNGWMLSIVGNKAGALLARIDLYEPFSIAVEDIPVKVIKRPNPRLEEEIYNEVAAKVTKIPPPVVRIYKPYRPGEPTPDWEPRQLALRDNYDDNGEWIGG